MATRMWLSICMSVVLLAAVVQTQTSDWFHCQRDDNTCQGSGSCAASTGICTCTDATTEGYDCKGDSTLKRDTGCALSCDASSYGCYEFTTGTETCYCTADKKGTTCSEPRATVTCDGSIMSVTMEPLSTASILFVPGFETTAGCYVTPTGSSFSIDLSLTSGCGAAVVGTTTLENTPTTGDNTYKNWLVLRYVGGLESPLNNIFEVSCVIGESALYTVVGQINQVSVNYLSNLLPATLDSTLGDAFSLKVLASDNSEITAPVEVGTEIKLELSLKSTDVVAGVKFSSCAIRNTQSSASSVSVSIIESGCAMETGPAVHAVRGALTLMADSSIVLPMTAVKFNDQDLVYFVCEVQVCFTACTQPSCVTTSVKRRRRAVSNSNDGDQQRTLVAALTVVDRYTKHSAGNKTLMSQSSPATISEDECGLSITVITALAVFGIGVLLLSVVSITLVVKYLKMKRASSKEEDTIHRGRQFQPNRNC